MHVGLSPEEMQGLTDRIEYFFLNGEEDPHTTVADRPTIGLGPRDLFAIMNALRIAAPVLAEQAYAEAAKAPGGPVTVTNLNTGETRVLTDE
jgi:hypothetical protein